VINVLHIGVVVLVALIMLSPLSRLLSRPAPRRARQTGRGALTLVVIGLIAIGLVSFVIATVISEKWILFIGSGVFAAALILRMVLLKQRPTRRPEDSIAEVRKQS
jgi:hypothetical protein